MNTKVLERNLYKKSHGLEQSESEKQKTVIHLVRAKKCRMGGKPQPVNHVTAYIKDTGQNPMITVHRGVESHSEGSSYKDPENLPNLQLVQRPHSPSPRSARFTHSTCFTSTRPPA